MVEPINPRKPPTRKQSIGRKLLRATQGFISSQQDTGAPRPLPPYKLAALTQIHEIQLQRTQAPHTVKLKVGVIDLALPDSVHFAEHVRDAASNATDEVILLGQHHIYASQDLGHTWKAIDTREITSSPLQRSFTTTSGVHLIQGMGWAQSADDRKPQKNLAPILRFNKDWRFLSIVWAGHVHWHGTASIGQTAETIMFAEYPVNVEGSCDADHAHHLRPSRVWRSRDEGQTWDCVLTISAGVIRHFHTCVPDPVRARCWWVSSGDNTNECFIWRSEDDGDCWTDVTNQNPDVPLPSSMRNRKRSIHRCTDLHFDGGHLIWGTDDSLGDLSLETKTLGDEIRPGARMYRATLRDGKLMPEELGWVGPPVRSMVDTGSAWIVLTEAKKAIYSLRPRVFLLFKDEPHRVHHLFDIENFSGEETGFTYSVASRFARNGVFFTNRSGRDGFPSGIAALRWEISFR